MAKTFYLTTTLPYVNADPHIGFALELVHADIVARYHRNVLGDEHGQKVFQKAKEEGRAIQEYVDFYANRFSSLATALNLSNDTFIRTTDPSHVKAAEELWRRCEKDIYKRKYKGLYCIGDEAFLRETDLVDGRCPNHPNLLPQEVEEENYFFRLSAYQEKLHEYLSASGVIVPEWRRQEALRFVSAGLEDFSISREKTKVSWGVPVPGDDTQVMYVWFDALTNYISTLGWPEDTAGNFKKFWNEAEVVQMAGKDQVRFQSIMWQAMLMSAGLKNTNKVIYHGFITSGGQKMSKSLGNVIDPFLLIEEYGTDAVRYFLAAHVNSFEDSDVTPERFKELYNAYLANGIGNLVSRVMQLASTHDVHIKEKALPKSASSLPESLSKAVAGFEVTLYAATVGLFISTIDEKIAKEKPFSVIKEDKEKGKKMIEELLTDIHWVEKIIEPVMPDTANKILEAILENKKPENLFPRKE
jgi:methionyl-tRNA synthetase